MLEGFEGSDRRCSVSAEHASIERLDSFSPCWRRATEESGKMRTASVAACSMSAWPKVLPVLILEEGTRVELTRTRDKHTGLEQSHARG